eukprot:3647011-Pyramimonas_sp.AAC.1
MALFTAQAFPRLSVDPATSRVAHRRRPPGFASGFSKKIASMNSSAAMTTFGPLALSHAQGNHS